MKFKNLLERVKVICAVNELEIRDSGQDFNIISILGMENNERYTHSAIIAELLNPNGTHGFGNLFLKEFLKITDILDFDVSNCQVIIEEYAGVITHNEYISRTFVDIVLRNNCDQEILIENKIWAIDQHKQLERTFRGGKCSQRKVVYLTPFGHDYVSDDENLVYTKISYKEHVSKWLEVCINASSSNPLVSNLIKSYKNIVDKITNQNLYKKMNDEIEYEILLSLNNLKAAEKIAGKYAELNRQVWDKFWVNFKKFLQREYSGTVQEGKYTYEYEINEKSNDNVFLQIRFIDEEGKIILHNEEINSIVEKLRHKFNGRPDDKSVNWNIWFYAEKGDLYNTLIYKLSLEHKYEILKNGDFNNEIQNVAIRFKSVLEFLDNSLKI